MGIGTTSPGSLLHVTKNGNGGDVELARFEGTNASDHPYLTIGGTPSSSYHAGFIMYNKGTDVMLIDRHGDQAAKIAFAVNSGGQVGIGTTTPDAKLAVKGTIHSQEVKVDMSGWNDFVFDKAYPLPALSAVKTYVDQNHHLPEMPSAAEIIKNGVNLGEMVKLQTKKIEELTLYLIDKDEQVNRQNAKLAQQTAQLRQQDARISALEKALLKLTGGK